MTRILAGPSSRANPRVKPVIAELAVTYAGSPAAPAMYDIEEKFIIEPPPMRFMPRAANWTEKKYGLRFTA